MEIQCDSCIRESEYRHDNETQSFVLERGKDAGIRRRNDESGRRVQYQLSEVLIIPDLAKYFRFCSYSDFNVVSVAPTEAVSVEEFTEYKDSLEGINSKIEVEKKHLVDLRNKAISASKAYVSSGNSIHWYGVSYIEEDMTSTNVTRISDWVENGIMPLHLADDSRGLPLQKKMRRCLFKDGSVNYYLNSTNSLLKEDGTSAILTGADGDIMVELPEYWYKIEKEDATYNSNPATKVSIKISEYFIDDTWMYSPKSYVGAVESSMDRTTNELRNIVLTNFMPVKNVSGKTW